MLNFTFGGNTDMTYEELQARRRIAERLGRSGGAPRNVGEGLNRIGEAIAYRMISRRNQTAEERLREEADAQWGEFMDTFMGGSGGGAGGYGGGYGGTTGSTRSFTGPATANAAGVMEAVSGNTDAPTAGLRYMLPAENPDEFDPRGGAFATGASRSDDPNIYTTSVTGATGGVSPEIIDIVGNSVEQAYGPGAAVGVSSGLRPGSRGSQHSAGNALDFNVTDRAGNRSSYADPRIFDAARVAASQGASGIGIGPDYMGGETFHFDTGQGGATAPNFGNTVRTWSDWNTGANLARYGRNSAGPQGAGDPNFGFQAELQGIRDGASVPTGTVGPVTASARNPMPDAPAEFGAMADAAAEAAGIDPALFRRLIQQESGWNPTITSPAGAYGLTQVMPETARSPGFGVAPLTNPNDPAEQLRFGAEYLAAMIEQHGGNVEQALAAYNGGPGRLAGVGGDISRMPQETRDYVGIVGGGTGAPVPGSLTATASAQNQPQGGSVGGSGGAQDPRAMIAALLPVLNNPMLSDGQRMVAGALMQQALGQAFAGPADPMDAIELETAQLELEMLRQEMEGGGDRARLITGAEAEALGLPPGAYNQLPDGRITAIGGGGTTINNNMGGETGEWLYGTDGGVPAGWRVNTITGEASRIPGGPADVEADQAANQAENRLAERRLMLGTSLENINLNIAEIENGGMPVTGGWGDLRRTGVGRLFTGSDAVDFGNRTAQITDSAALAEIQRMRENSPTGGAVGALTDGERVAIGNAVTALNNSTSAEEYLRAARNYRDLVLDLAYGEGTWELAEDGSVTMRQGGNATAPEQAPADAASGAPQAAPTRPADFAEMDIDALMQVDISTLSGAMLDAFEARWREVTR